MFLCKSIGIYGTVQNTRSQIFTLFNITLDLGASPLKVKKLWQQQQLSWSQKLQILFPTWFPEVHMHISNTICNYPEFQPMIEGSSLKHKYFKQDLLHYLRGRKTLRVWFGYSNSVTQTVSSIIRSFSS